MKCDELTSYKGDIYIPVYGSVSDADVYLKEKVDEAIAELKHKLEDVKELIKTARQMLEDAKASHYAEMVDAGMREHKLKRALWLARADRAKTEYNHWTLIWHCEINNHLFFINKTRYKYRAKVDRLHYPWEWRDIWYKVERKCRAKSEEYK